MENLKKMQHCLICLAEEQIYGNLEHVDAKELGEVMDMIKDISETIYYTTITEAMEGEDEWHEEKRYTYKDPRHKKDKHMPMHKKTDDWDEYYDGELKEYEPHIYRDGMMQDAHNAMMRDPKEGRSGERRKMYMDGKGMKDKSKQMQELEAYMNELAQDMIDMIQDASPEEKQLLQTKIATLAAKVK